MIGDRLKEERERLGITQPIFAEAAGAKKRTLIDWEKGVSSPTAVQLSALSEIGVDVLYVITGQHRSFEAAVDNAPLSDRERLAAAIEAVTEGLAEAKRQLPPKKLAELIMAAYDLMSDPVKSRDNVIKLVRMVA